MQDKVSGVMVSNVRLEHHNEYNELSADVDGEEIWVRVPHDFPLIQRGEVFVAAALLEAMIRNEPLFIDDNAPISPKLLSNLTELQNIYSCWNTDLSVVSIHANTDVPEDEEKAPASYFSGGIDSSHTLLTHMNEIMNLIHIRGFGEFLEDKEWSASVARHTAFANSLNKTLIPIDSNIWLFFHKRKISVYFFYGLILGGLAGTLGFKKIFIPSSTTYSELFPWGSHPLTDPLWSTEQVKIVHDSAQYRRTEKTEMIASVPEILDNLQVCWMSNEHNCGTCSKCVRTRVTLDLLGVKTDKIPGISSNSQLKAFYPEDASGLFMLEDVMLLAKSKNADATYKSLRKGWIKYQRKLALVHVDRIFLGGLLRRIKHLKPAPWRKMRVLLTPKERIDF